MHFGATKRQRLEIAQQKRHSVAVLHEEAFEVPTKPISGRELILAVEDLYNRFSSRTLQQNQFWRALIKYPETVPNSVYFGMCIENYHLLFRESYFDSPVLSFAPSRAARQIINEFYCEELGHDRLLLQSLESIGLTEEELFQSIPLQQTMALCNALSYWARHDPLFFFTTLGPLEGRDVEIDSYVTAMYKKGLPEVFVGPIHTHANINKNAAHGLLTRELFERIPVVSTEDATRIMKQTFLFISIYNRFYSGIWEYYSNCESLLRPIRDI